MAKNYLTRMPDWPGAIPHDPVGWFEEYAFLQGNGVGKPLGVLNAPAAISGTRNTANQVKVVDLATMLSKLLPSSQGRAIWAVHPYVLAQLVQLADAGGRIIWVPRYRTSRRVL